MNRLLVSLGNMKPAYFVCFLCGAAMMFDFSTLRGSDSPHHVYELRLYHVNEGKMDALEELRVEVALRPSSA